MTRTLLAAAAGALVLCASGPASAQLHWDASAQVGVQKRFLANQRTEEDATFGPAAMLNAHLALLPLLRLGAYLGHDISPLDGDSSARDMTWGGVRAKILSPWPRGKTRAYVFAGFGYEGVYARSTTSPGGIGPVTRDGATGGFFEVPFGLGASYTFWKPWAVVVELGGRAGFGFSGSAYEPPGPTVQVPPSAPPGGLGAGRPDGEDRIGIGLTLGIMLDE